MRRRLISTLVLAVLALPVAGMAAGDPPTGSRPAPSPPRNPVDKTPDTGMATFRSLDTNKDGYVSRDEARSSSELTARFAELDQDRDGSLSRQELGVTRSAATTSNTAGPPKPGAARVNVAADDPPASSRPPRSRPRNAVDRSRTDPGIATFNSLDADRDGYLSREEARASSALAKQFDALDNNRDGKVSLHELTGWRSASYASGTNLSASNRSTPTVSGRTY